MALCSQVPCRCVMDPNPHTLVWGLGQEEKKGSWKETPIMVSMGLQLTKRSQDSLWVQSQVLKVSYRKSAEALQNLKTAAGSCIA